MLFTDYDDCGIPIYTVCNNQGLCLIRTTDSAIAEFVEYHSKNVDPSLRLTVGGDRGTHQYNNPIFTHIRRITK